MFKKRILSGLTVLAIVGLALGAIGCTPQSVVLALATPVPATATVPPAAATPIPATLTSLPATPTTVLSTTTSLPPAVTQVPAKIIDLTKNQIEKLDLEAVDSDFQGLRYSFTDGKYGYFLVKPITASESGYDSGKVARVDL
jgi:hypothetical protein